jgi:hypothetical protein
MLKKKKWSAPQPPKGGVNIATFAHVFYKSLMIWLIKQPITSNYSFTHQELSKKPHPKSKRLSTL